MAVDIYPRLTMISDANTTTNWSAGVLNDVFQLEGSNCLGLKVSETQSVTIKYDHGAGGIDISNGEHYYQWIFITGKPETKNNSGITLYVEDTSGNYGYWNVAGSDNYGGGWACYVVDIAGTPTRGSGTIVTTAVRYTGLQFNIFTKALGNTPNVFWDICWYGTGLEITSLSTDIATMNDIKTAEDSGYYGVVNYSNGVYFIQGKLIFGTSYSGITFSDSSQQIVFINNEFASTDLYEIIISGNTTDTTKFQLGTKSGNSGIQGFVINSPSSDLPYKLDFDEEIIDELKIYGTQFLNADLSYFPTYSGDTSIYREMLNVTFSDSNVADINTMTMENCQFINADYTGITYPTTYSNENTNYYFKNNSFIGNEIGIKITSGGTYYFSGLLFDSNTYDVFSTTSDNVVVNLINSSDASTTGSTGGSVSILSAVSIDIFVYDSDQNLISGAYVYLDEDLDSAGNIINTITTGTGEVNTSYTGSATSATLRVRKYGYKNFSSTISLTSDSSTNVTLVTDTNQY